MHARKFLGPVLLLLVALAGCKEETPSEGGRQWISVSALPVIQGAVFSLAPTFEGQRNPVLMGPICSLARGQASQDQVNAQLAALGIDAAKLPQQSPDATALLVNGDKAGQATACAAFLATSVLLPADTGEFTTPGATPQAGNPVPISQIDQGRLKRVLQIKVARAQTNADLFALIAKELQRSPGLTVEQARAEAGRLFARLAPVYLERVGQQGPAESVHFAMVRLDLSHFAFTSDAGTSFEFAPETGLILRQHGQLVYGRGLLLGQDPRLQLAYFDDKVRALLSPQRAQ